MLAIRQPLVGRMAPRRRPRRGRLRLFPAVAAGSCSARPCGSGRGSVRCGIGLRRFCLRHDRRQPALALTPAVPRVRQRRGVAVREGQRPPRLRARRPGVAGEVRQGGAGAGAALVAAPRLRLRQLQVHEGVRAACEWKNSWTLLQHHARRIQRLASVPEEGYEKCLPRQKTRMQMQHSW